MTEEQQTREEWARDRTTVEEHAAQAARSGLVPVRLIPVEFFCEDQCDECEAALAYGICDATEGYSDCNRAYNKLLRYEDSPQNKRVTDDTILVWVSAEEREKFLRVLGEPRMPVPSPAVLRYEDKKTGVKWLAAVTAIIPQKGDIGELVPIPNTDDRCKCALVEDEDGSFTGVTIAPGCLWHAVKEGGEAAEDLRESQGCP